MQLHTEPPCSSALWHLDFTACDSFHLSASVLGSFCESNPFLDHSARLAAEAVSRVSCVVNAMRSLLLLLLSALRLPRYSAQTSSPCPHALNQVTYAWANASSVIDLDSLPSACTPTTCLVSTLIKPLPFGPCISDCYDPSSSAARSYHLQIDFPSPTLLSFCSFYPMGDSTHDAQLVSIYNVSATGSLLGTATGSPLSNLFNISLAGGFGNSTYTRLYILITKTTYVRHVHASRHLQITVLARSNCIPPPVLLRFLPFLSVPTKLLSSASLAISPSPSARRRRRLLPDSQ